MAYLCIRKWDNFYGKKKTLRPKVLQLQGEHANFVKKKSERFNRVIKQALLTNLHKKSFNKKKTIDALLGLISSQFLKTNLQKSLILLFTQKQYSV